MLVVHLLLFFRILARETQITLIHIFHIIFLLLLVLMYLLLMLLERVGESKEGASSRRDESINLLVIEETLLLGEFILL